MRIAQPTTDIFLKPAIEEARQGLAEAGILIGSALLIDGHIVGPGHKFIRSKPELWNEVIGE